MIRIIVVDLSAESRNNLSEQITSFFRADSLLPHFCPQVSVKSLSPHECRFHEEPDLCIVGPLLLEVEPQSLSQLRQTFPQTTLLANLGADQESIDRVSEIIRLGANDTCAGPLKPTDLVKKVLLLAREKKFERKGKVILVDAGKGGVGRTSVSALMADYLATIGKRVALIDLDLESQDLTRFLLVTPILNENLQLILSQSRPALAEYVQQCVSPVGSGSNSFVCMAPCPDNEQLYDPRTISSRIFFSVLQVLDTLYDVLIIDSGSFRGAALRALHHFADHTVFVTNNQSSSLYASVERIRRANPELRTKRSVVMLNNGAKFVGVSESLLLSETLALSESTDLPVKYCALPRSTKASDWPGSNSTMLGLGGTPFRKAVMAIAEACELMPPEEKRSTQNLRDTLFTPGFARQTSRFQAGPIIASLSHMSRKLLPMRRAERVPLATLPFDENHSTELQRKTPDQVPLPAGPRLEGVPLISGVSLTTIGEQLSGK